MGVITMSKNQITLYYSSENSLGKQVKAYVISSTKKHNIIDVSKTNLTGTQWAEIASGLHKNISDLIDQNHPDFIAAYGDSEVNLDDDGWLKVLDKNPSLLANPIAINGTEYIELDTAAAFKKYISSDSAGLKKPYNK